MQTLIGVAAKSSQRLFVVLLWLTFVTGATMSNQSSATLAYAFAGSDSNGCPGCVYQLRLNTDSGPLTVASFDRGISAFLGGQPIGQTLGKTVLVGFCCTSQQELEYRNWLAFNLLGASIISSASLEMTLPIQTISFASPTNALLYTLHGIDFLTEAQYLGGGGTEQFQVLGSGPVWGERIISGSERGSIISIQLNQLAINYLNLARLNVSRQGFEQPLTAIALLGGAATISGTREIPTLDMRLLLMLIGALLALAAFHGRLKRS